MTTQEVAEKLIGLCREGKYQEAYGLYAEDAVSQEMPGVPNELTRGLDNILKGYAQWASNIQEIHGGSVGEPLVVDNHFAVPMTTDVTFKDGRRVLLEEISLYQVENGKITRASFHYDPTAMSG